MKDFWKYVLATIVGILLIGAIMMALGAMSLVGIIASGEKAATIGKNSVLVLNLNGSMEEQAIEDYKTMLMGGGMTSMGFAETLDAIKKAKDHDNIKGIYIEANGFSADFAQLEELRQALNDFKKSGKWIVSYADNYSQGEYYLASVANKIYMNPSGMLDWHGLAAQPMFVKDVLKKAGIKMQVVKVGKYKSATEMYTEDKMSDANREQTMAYLTSLWNNVTKSVSASRGISVADLNLYADSMQAFCDAKEVVKHKFVDQLVYAEQVKTEIKKLLKLDKDDRINQVFVSDMANVKSKQKGDEIAVYYAYGNIVDQESQGMLMGGGHAIVGKNVCADLEALMNDDDVKAVVLRVNSPGGSAYASEQIWHQVELLKQKKPVVVSMSGYAASGGYYISSGAQYIVADPTTITGSIGIFGTFMDRSELMTQKLGLKYDEVKTNKNATFGTSSRPFNSEELSMLQNYIDRGYSLFRSRVAQGRKMTVDQVEQVAQGHVFTGEDALKLKLVDELGGLDKAVAKAATLAKLKDYHTINYPAPPSLLDQVMGLTSGGNNLDEMLRAELGEFYEPLLILREAQTMYPIQARMPFIPNFK